MHVPARNKKKQLVGRAGIALSVALMPVHAVELYSILSF